MSLSLQDRVVDAPWVNRWEEMGRPSGPDRINIHILKIFSDCAEGFSFPSLTVTSESFGLSRSGNPKIHPASLIEIFTLAETSLQNARTGLVEARENASLDQWTGWAATALSIALLSCAIFCATSGSALLGPAASAYFLMSLYCWCLATDSYEETKDKSSELFFFDTTEESSSAPLLVLDIALAAAFGFAAYLKSQTTKEQRWVDAIDKRLESVETARRQLNRGFQDFHRFYIEGEWVIQNRIAGFPQSSSPVKDDELTMRYLMAQSRGRSREVVIEAFRQNAQRALAEYQDWCRQIAPPR